MMLRDILEAEATPIFSDTGVMSKPNLISYMSLEAVILANAGIQLVTPTRSVISGAMRGLRAGFPPATRMTTINRSIGGM